MHVYPHAHTNHTRASPHCEQHTRHDSRGTVRGMCRGSVHDALLSVSGARWYPWGCWGAHMSRPRSLAIAQRGDCFFRFRCHSFIVLARSTVPRRILRAASFRRVCSPTVLIATTADRLSPLTRLDLDYSIDPAIFDRTSPPLAQQSRCKHVQVE